MSRNPKSASTIRSRHLNRLRSLRDYYDKQLGDAEQRNEDLPLTRGNHNAVAWAIAALEVLRDRGALAEVDEEVRRRWKAESGSEP